MHFFTRQSDSSSSFPVIMYYAIIIAGLMLNAVAVAEVSSVPNKAGGDISNSIEQLDEWAQGTSSESTGSVRKRRDLSTDLLDAASSIGIGGGYIKKFNNLIHGVPPNVREAFIEQDFSNVSESDIRNLNISVLEYIPPKVLSKMNMTYLSPIIDRLLQGNKPMALSRVMQVASEKMDANQILDKIKKTGGMSDQNEEAANVLLYTALNQVGDKGGINTGMIRRLANEGLLSLVPEEQLLKVTDPNAAKQLLNRLYVKANSGSDTNELNDVDDKALVYKLTEVGYGQAEKWSADTIRGVGPKIMSFMPADFLKKLSPDAIATSISTLKDTKFERPMQAKAITDAYLENNGVSNKATSEDLQGVAPAGLAGIMANLGPLAAYVNPLISKDTSFLSSIVSACDTSGLPAPLRAVSEIMKQKISSAKSIGKLGYEDLREMGISLLKSGPPQLMEQAVKKRALTETDLNEIASETNKKDLQNGGGGGSIFSSGPFRAIIAQVAQYAVQYFTRGGKINFGGLPGAFMGALGIKGMNDMTNRDLDDAVDKLKNNPDSLDDAQKALLLKKLRDAGMLDSIDLPPEIRGLQPRKKGEDDNDYNKILDGLPSDSELRLAHGSGKRITARMLERDKHLVGTLTPAQVNEIDLEEIPAVLAEVRKSKDGPQPKTLEALSKRFAEYVRAKSEDYDSPDKKLLKYMSAAEVSKLPATVLAYFIDHRQTSKLPPQVRKEIMIAMGELSTKDHSAIPGKTRDEIILQGLDALDSLSGASNKIDIPELAAIGHGVVDLPPERVAKLTPVAVETALQIIQGTADDDDDGLKQRACLTQDQRKAWSKKIIEQYGEPSSWDSATVSSLCCAIGILDEDDLQKITKEFLVTCSCVADDKPPSHLAELKKALDINCNHEVGEDTAQRAKTTVQKLKSEVAFDLEDLESQILTSRKRRSASSAQLTCYKVRLTGSGSAFSNEQLETLDDKDIQNCIYELGLDPLPQESASTLWKKLPKPKNRVEADDIRYAGYILSGITLNDVNDLDLDDPDVVLAFGKPLGLSKSVLEKLASKLEQAKEKRIGEYDVDELVITGNILCGFSADDLTKISGEAFRYALPVLKNIEPSCEQTRLSALAAVATRPEVFGDPKSWTAADVRGVGTILKGLSASSVKSIPAEAFMGLTSTVAPTLSSETISELSVEQLGYIPRFSAQAISDDQLAESSDETKDTLKSVVSGPVSSTAATNTLKLFTNFLWLATTLLVITNLTQGNC